MESLAERRDFYKEDKVSEESKALEESLKGYKEKVSPEMKLNLHLDRV